MNLQRNLYVLIILITIYNKTLGSNLDLTVVRKGLDVVTPCSAGLVFFVDVNNTSDDDFDVELTPVRCCVGEDENCEVLEVIGACVENIPKGTSKTLKAVAPLLNPFERTGNCIFYLDSKPSNVITGTMRDEVKVTFNTQLNNKDQPMLVPNNVKPCGKADEDPLKDCNPVDCDSYYNGKKSYFNKNTGRCASIPSCVAKRNIDVPSVYDPVNNKCVAEQFITNDDLDFIKELAENGRRTKDVLIIQNISQDEDEAVNNTAVSTKKKHNNTQNTCFKYIIAKYISGNKWTFSVLGVVILVQCCLICTMLYFLTKNCRCCNKKKVVKKFFNYRQDASVTTPLIGTSNMDTETTDFNYSSDFTNINNKIKCYKACQKERRSNVKMSMSDDILSKCINRRDWNSKPVRSDAIAEVINMEGKKQTSIEEPKSYQIIQNDYLESSETVIKNNIIETKINLVNEVPCKINEYENNFNEIATNKPKKIDYKGTESKETQCDLSEKEIRCHSYNYMGVNSNVAEYYPSTHSKILGYCTTDQKRNKTVSVSTEKSVQAAFSNDSIDDYLSERGMMFLAGENLSKYSFSSASNNVKKSPSSASCKTSKNKLVKNVLSLLQIRPKHSPSSDPGTRNDRPIDMQLIHMSNASIGSSNSNESDYLKGKKPKD